MSARIVPLDAFLLDRLVQAERDPLTAELCAHPAWASRVLAIPGLAYAVLDGPDLVAGGGLVPMWPGRAEAWALVSRFARKRQLVKAVQLAAQTVAARQRDPSFRRIEMFVRCDPSWCRSFIAGLGFVREGLLKAWDPAGRDVWMCARIGGAT